MLKKLFITAAAAAVVSVPLAGVAWADPPSDPGANDKGSSGENKLGSKGGLPAHVGKVVNDKNPTLFPKDDPVVPGAISSNIAKLPGSVPDAFGNFVNDFWGSATPSVPDTNYGPTPPGLAVKSFTPGCSHGRQATNNDGVIPAGVDPCY